MKQSEASHKMKVISLFDGEAVCSCGRWQMGSTGETTISNMSAQWRLHVPPTTSTKANQKFRKR